MVERGPQDRGIGDFPFPFYDGWPPQALFSDDDAMTIKGLLPRWAILLLIGAVGIIAIIAGHLLAGTVGEVLRDLGIATLIAAMLGFTIDRWFKTDLVKDVFDAVLGHVLPEEFKNEIRTIINHKMLCENLYTKIELKEIDDNTVRMTVTTERTVKNITKTAQPVEAAIRIDDWGFTEPAKVHECRMELPNGTVVEAKPVESPPSRIFFSSEEHKIGPNEEVKYFTKFSEIHRINDIAIFHYGSPTRNPVIEIDAPDSLGYAYGFGSSSPVLSARYTPRHTLQGVYFPTQSMRVRWWRNEEPTLNLVERDVLNSDGSKGS